MLINCNSYLLIKRIILECAFVRQFLSKKEPDMPCKTKRHYLHTLQVSRSCFLSLQSSIDEDKLNTLCIPSCDMCGPGLSIIL